MSEYALEISSKNKILKKQVQLLNSDVNKLASIIANLEKRNVELVENSLVFDYNLRYEKELDDLPIHDMEIQDFNDKSFQIIPITQNSDKESITKVQLPPLVDHKYKTVTVTDDNIKTTANEIFKLELSRRNENKFRIDGINKCLHSFADNEMGAVKYHDSLFQPKSKIGY